MLCFFAIYHGSFSTNDAKTSRTQPAGDAQQSSWDLLGAMVQEKTDDPICDFFYMKDDSGSEYAFLFTGVKREENSRISFQGSLWYADAQGCILAQDRIETERFEPVLIEHGAVKHLLFQTSSNLPGDAVSYIWTAKNHKPVLALETPNFCFLDNDKLAIVKTFYSNGAGRRIWQRYYLYWDAKKETYREYKGRAITEEQFLSYENALETRNTVEAAIKKELIEYHNAEQMDRIEYNYLIRDNGILNINFEFFCGNDVFYYYAILAEKNGQVTLKEWKDYNLYEPGYIYDSGDFGIEPDSEPITKVSWKVID